MRKVVFLFFIALSVQSLAQGVKIAPVIGNPYPSAGLEVDYPDKGILIPRIQLTDVNDVLTIPAPVQSLLVFNIGSSGAGNDTVYEGYYYWSADSTKWLRISSGGSDDQNIDSVTINGTVITVFIEDGNSASADLIGIASDSLFYTTIANNLVTNDTTLKWFRDSVNVLTNIFNTDSTISYVDENGDTTVIDVLAMIDSSETLTFVSQIGDSSFSYTNEDGVIDTINLSGLRDHDWYDKNTGLAPTSINDTIYTNGYIGIGISNPTNVLQIGSVGGTGYAGNAIAIGNGADAMAINSAGGRSVFTANTSFDFVGAGDFLIYGNNLGLGTVSPTHKLDVVGEARIRTINDTTDISNILTSNATGVIQKLPYDSIVNSIRDSIADHDWYDINTGSAPRTINDTIYTMGRVGIGTNNPSGKLQVFLDRDATIDSSFVIKESGRVGIGTDSPRARLHLEGATMNEAKIIINNYGPPANGSVISFESQGTEIAQITGNTGDGLNGNVLFYTADGGVSSEKMRLDSLGYLGIGTASPSEKLEVVGNILASGTIVSSDRRYKRDIHTLDRALEKLLQLRGVSYFMKDEYKDKGFGDGLQIGVIAQEVEKVYPELVNTNDKTGYKAVDYSKFTPILIEAVKEQQEQIEVLKNENTQFKAENTTVNESIESLKIENQKLKEDYNELKSELEQIKLILNKQDLGKQ